MCCTHPAFQAVRPTQTEGDPLHLSDSLHARRVARRLDQVAFASNSQIRSAVSGRVTSAFYADSMSRPRRPDAAHLVDLSTPTTRRQLLARNPRDLVQQLAPLVPDLPPATVRQLAQMVLDHDAQVQLARPLRLTLRHAGTLTRAAPEPAALTSAPAQAEEAQAEAEAGAGSGRHVVHVATPPADEAPAPAEAGQPPRLSLGMVRRPPRPFDDEQQPTANLAAETPSGPDTEDH